MVYHKKEKLKIKIKYICISFIEIRDIQKQLILEAIYSEAF